MTSFLVEGGGGGFLGTDVSQGNDVCPWISCATLYMVMVHGQQGAEKNGRWNAHSALGRCVMRRETGSRALESAHCSKNGGNKEWFLDTKSETILLKINLASFKTRSFSCRSVRIKMLIPSDLKQLKAYVLAYV